MLIVHSEGPLRTVPTADANDGPAARPGAADDVFPAVYVPAARGRRHRPWVRRQLRFSQAIRRGQGMRWRPVRWMASALFVALLMPPSVFGDSINEKID